MTANNLHIAHRAVLLTSHPRCQQRGNMHGGGAKSYVRSAAINPHIPPTRRVSSGPSITPSDLSAMFYKVFHIFTPPWLPLPLDTCSRYSEY